MATSSPQQSRPVLVTSSRPEPGERTVPWDGQIKWALETSSIFANASATSGDIFSRRLLSESWIFQYGLRYIPAPDEKCFRTVKIENLPGNATLDQVLLQIREAGAVYTARLLNTKAITGSHTALITFIEQIGAHRFLQHQSKTGLWIGHTKARATLVSTPAYPMPADMEQLIFKHDRTRCLTVHNVDEPQVIALYNVLTKSPCHHYLEHIDADGLVDHGKISLRFHSVRIAVIAFGLIKADKNFGNSKVEFAKDPCDRSKVID